MKYTSRMILEWTGTLKRRPWKRSGLEVGCRVIRSSRLKLEALDLAPTAAIKL
jgi:hypothetical protein